ncbi:MAG: biopolymer transport protein ExbD [Gammaproteobacteria bacterium]|jgi:biopolymer transport protein ExbD
MNFKPRETETLELNLTPLIDVVFLLLIFFMVSTTFERSSELAIELPTSTAESATNEEVTLEISVDSQGQFYVNGRQLVNTQLGTVREALRQAAGKDKAAPLVVNADAKAPYQAVVTVMDAARQLGLSRLRFPTSQATE